MSLFLNRVWRGLTANAATTAPDATDPRLRGRTYAIPFEQVWQAALALADGGLPRWRLLKANDHDGIIRARARTALLGLEADVTIQIGLDADAQTRVDARAARRAVRADLGVNARRIASFFRALDRDLARPARRTAGRR